MRKTKRRPVSVGEMLKVEFLEPMASHQKRSLKRWAYTEIRSVI